MAQLGQYKTPRELKDEDLWFKYFKKKQVAIAFIVLAVDGNIVSFSHKIHLTVVGVTLAMLFTILAGIIALGSMPKNKHLYGGGLELDKIFIRLIKRKALKSSKIVYTNIGSEDDGGLL